MNNNAEQIAAYLQNRMDEADKKAFENRLSEDTSLQQEVNIQRRIADAAVHAGMKQEFGKAIRQRIMIRRSLLLVTVIILVVTSLLVLNTQNSKWPVRHTDEAAVIAGKGIYPFIQPPLAQVNVPLAEYSFPAEKGDTIFHATGSVIYFPPNALVDKDGNLIKGTVKVTYREFTDPSDFFISGIPMQYDSAGKTYNFESSGMCEIYAYKDGAPVFVNPMAAPLINLSAKNQDPSHNLYYLDTAARRWNFIGKDTITKITNTTSHNKVPEIIEGETTLFPVKPVKPEKASGDRPTFSIAIDPGSFEELFSYDHLRFEVMEERTYNRADADEHWDNVKLDRTSRPGIYNITFSNTGRKVTYSVRPVLEGGDYDAAIKVFTEKNREYEVARQMRLKKEHLQSDSITKLNREQEKINASNREWTDRMNALITERNKKIKERRAELEKIAAAQQQAAEDQLLLIARNREKYSADIRLSAEVMRTFSINNFGIWNCDHPQYPDYEININAKYVNLSGDIIPFSNISVVYKGFNGITQFASPSFIRIMPESENMIWGISGEEFYFFSYNDFKKAGLDRSASSFVFKMQQSVKKITSYNDMRELLTNLYK